MAPISKHKMKEISPIDVAKIRSYYKKYLQMQTKVINDIFAMLDDRGISAYDPKVEEIVDDYITKRYYENRVPGNPDDDTTIHLIKATWNDIVHSSVRFYSDSRNLTTISANQCNTSFRKIADKLKYDFVNVDDLAKFTKMELCELLSTRYRCGNKNIINAIELMIEYNVILADCKDKDEMIDFARLLKVVTKVPSKI